MAYKINWTDNGVYITSFGSVKIGDVIEVVGILIADSRFDSLVYIIKDFQNVSDFVMVEHDLKSIYSLTKIPTRWNSDIKSCFITRNNELKKMFLKFIELMKLTKWEMKVFDSNEDAIEWCNQEQNIVSDHDKNMISTFSNSI